MIAHLLAAEINPSTGLSEELSHVLPLTVLVLLGVGIPVGMMVISWILNKNSPTIDQKSEPYECGLTETLGTADERFSVKFYIIAMLFLVFDLEVAFLFPLALEFRSIEGWGIFGILLVFLVILEVAYLYLYRKGALDWD